MSLAFLGVRVLSRHVQRPLVANDQFLEHHPWHHLCCITTTIHRRLCRQTASLNRASISSAPVVDRRRTTSSPSGYARCTSRCPSFPRACGKVGGYQGSSDQPDPANGAKCTATRGGVSLMETLLAYWYYANYRKAKRARKTFPAARRHVEAVDST